MATVTDLLERYPPAVRTLAEELRHLVLDAVPEANESVRMGWRSLGYAHLSAGYFVGLFLKADHVQALFEWGVLLPDPDQLLEGNGSQVRYIPVHRLDPLTSMALRRLLAAALDLPPRREAKLAMLAARQTDR